MKSRLAAFILQITLACIAVSLYASKGGGEDSLVAFSPIDTICKYQVPEGRSLIQKMNEEQLASLIDLLFELDTLPVDIVKEINIATEKFDCRKKNIAGVSCPASEHYEGWDEQTLFPYKEIITCKDTSLVLVLEGGQNGIYHHPHPGIITSGYGWRDSSFHKGMDINLKKGEKVFSAFDGKVRIAMRHGAYGNVVIVRHYNGLETLYAHLSKIKVKTGQDVTSGQVLGLGGCTGRATGPHLHFEVRYRSEAINPKHLISFDDKKLLTDTVVVRKTKWAMTAYPWSSKFHTVEKGDSLWKIAQRYGTTTAELARLNGISRKKSLKVGEKIRIS